MEPEQQGPEFIFESVEMEMNTEMGMPDIKMDTNMPPPMKFKHCEENVEEK